jgi:dGTPase
MEAHRRQTKRYLYAHLYSSPALEAEHDHAEQVVKSLFAAWTADPSLLPPSHRSRIPEEGLARTVADYIAGMTDAYIDQAWTQHQAGRRKNEE